jgi:4-amino-4-deoxy-L-arabinose transferase-like glycosyltransferase
MVVAESAGSSTDRTALSHGSGGWLRPAMVAHFAVIAFVVLFWRLGVPTFWDPDEAHYAETTRELLATGDWLAPYYNEQPFFDKPILFHLLQAVPMAVLGQTELAARLMPAVAALALMGITYWFGAAVVSAEAGYIAALLLVTSPGVFALARYAILDSLFTAFLFGGAALVATAALRDRSALQYGGYVLVALAVLIKGPLGLVLCGLAFLLAIAVSAEARRRLLALRWGIGLVIIVGLSAPWFVYMWRRFGEAFVEGYVLNENVRLFAKPLYGHQPGWLFYFRILAAGLLPWTPLAVGRFVDHVRALVQREPVDLVDTLLWTWTVAIVGFFSMSEFKLDHYVFPVAPALCLLCARAWHDLASRLADPPLKAARVGLILVGPLSVAVGVGVGVFVIARLALPWGAIVAPAAMAVVGAIVTVRLNLRGLPPSGRTPIYIPTAMAITYAAIVLFVMPALEQKKVVPDLARWVSARQEGARVAGYRLNRWDSAWRFYVGRHTDSLGTLPEAKAFFSQPGPAYCAMAASHYDELIKHGLQLKVAYERRGLWATSGRALWRHEPVPTQFVVVTRAASSPVLVTQP